MRIGTSWLGATALGLAALHLARAPGPRRFLLLGFAALLVPVSAKTFLQVGFEHSLVVSYYKEHKTEILARYGWQEGDSEARRFEGRLLRNDAKGVFSIANVFATVLIALTGLAIGLLGFSLSKWRLNGRVGPGILCAFLVVMGMVCLMLTQSRGGIGAFAIGGLVVLISALGERKWGSNSGWRVLSLLPIGALPIVIWALGAVSGEGHLLLDPSVAVRGWHLEAARVIWMEAPLAGVGPGRFQEAYMVHKNPLSPENVTDPHNIFATWLASMGLGGAAWVVLLLWLVWKATALVGLTGGAPQPEPQGVKGSRNCTLLLVAMALLFLLHYLVQVQEFGPQATLAWILGAGGAILVAFLLWREGIETCSVVRYGVLAGTLALIIHAQVDISMSDPMSAPLLFSILGIAAGFSEQGVRGGLCASREDISRFDSGKATSFQWPCYLNWSVCGLVGLVATLLLMGFVFPSYSAGRELRTAAREFTAGNAPSATNHLARALELLPSDPRPLYLIGLIKLQEASFLHSTSKLREAAALYRETIEAWDKAEELGSRKAFLCRRKGEVASRLFELVGEKEWGDTALKYAEKAVSLDPYNRYGYIRMAQVAERLGLCEKAKSWYEEALRLDELMTVLPDLRFSHQERKMIEDQLAELGKICHP